jgi:hypothetical protein
MISNARDKAPAVHKPSTAPRDAMTGTMTGTRRIDLSVEKQNRTPRFMPVLDNADPWKREGKNLGNETQRTSLHFFPFSI